MKFSVLLLCVFFVKESFGFNNSKCNFNQSNIYKYSINYKKNDLSKSIDSLSNCSETEPIELISVGKYLFDQNHYSEALDVLNTLIKNKNAETVLRGEAYCLKGLVYERINNIDSALVAYIYSANLGFQAHWVFNRIGEICSNGGYSELAIEAFNRSINIKNDYDEAFNNLGSEYRKVSDYQNALKCFKIANSLSRNNPKYHSNISRTYIDADSIEKNIKWAKNGHKIFPNDSDIIFDYIQCLKRTENYDSLGILVKELVRSDKKSGKYYFEIASSYMSIGYQDSAIYYYKSFLKYKPNNASAYHNISIIYNDFGMFKKGDSVLNIALEIEPNNPYFINSKITSLQWQHKYDEALEWCEKYYSYYPKGIFIDLTTGYLLLSKGEYKKSLPWFYKKLSNYKNDDRAMNNMARAYAKLGELDSAKKYFNMALVQNPSNSYIYHNLASFYCDLDKKDSACIFIETAINMEYNWTIDSCLYDLKDKHCPQLNLDRMINIYAYKGNVRYLRNENFITLKKSIEDIDGSIIPDYKLDSVTPENKYYKVQDQIIIFPNPNNGKFTLKIESESFTAGVLIIFDNSGEIVQKFNCESNAQEIDIPSLSNGIYSIIFENDITILSTQLKIEK